MPDVNNRDELENELARKLGRALSDVQADLLAALGDPPNLSNADELFWQGASGKLTRVLLPALEKITLAQAEQLLDELPLGVDWALVNSRAVNWASGYTFDLVRAINDTTRKLLQDQISRFFTTSGLTISDLRGMLAGAFGPVRAEMIATTEITRAAVEGERTLAAELADLGVETAEVWQTRIDETVCPVCGPRHGKREGDGWTKLDGPPAHPRCRCWTTTEIVVKEKA